MQIRRAISTDLDPIEKLWKEMMLIHAEFDDYFITTINAEDSHRSFMSNLIGDGGKRVFVAEKDGKLLGYIVVMIEDYPPIYNHKRFAEISAISVAESERRHGIGRKLLGAALDWCRSQGINRVECAVAVQNPVSQGFWKGVGFRSYMERCVMEL